MNDAKIIDDITKDMLQHHNISYKEISCEDAVEVISKTVLEILLK
jgi:hypothetical protein